MTGVQTCALPILSTGLIQKNQMQEYSERLFQVGRLKFSFFLSYKRKILNLFFFKKSGNEYHNSVQDYIHGKYTKCTDICTYNEVHGRMTKVPSTSPSPLEKVQDEAIKQKGLFLRAQVHTSKRIGRQAFASSNLKGSLRLPDYTSEYKLFFFVASHTERCCFKPC